MKKKKFEDKIKQICRTNDLKSLGNKLNLENIYGSKRMYHYTDVESLFNIIESGCFKLKKLGKSNDGSETNLYEKKYKEYYSISFCNNSNESIALWSLYRNGWRDSLRIGFKSSELNKIVDNNKAYLTQSDLQKNKESLEVKTELTTISYYDRYKCKLYFDSREINISKVEITDLQKNTDLIGKTKYNAWDYEKESRILVHLQEEKPEDEVYIEIPKTLLESMDIRFSPWVSKMDRKKIIKKLKKILYKKYKFVFDDNNQINESVYTGCVDEYFLARRNK